MSADEQFEEDRALWLSRLMFGHILDAIHHNDPPIFTETRSFEQFQADHPWDSQESR